MILSCSPRVARMDNSGWKATPIEIASEKDSLMRAISCQVSRFQSRTVASTDLEARSRLSAEKDIHKMEPVWPSRVRICCSVATSQKRIVLSVEAEANRRPSGDHTTVLT